MKRAKPAPSAHALGLMTQERVDSQFVAAKTSVQPNVSSIPVTTSFAWNSFTFLRVLDAFVMISF